MRYGNGQRVVHLNNILFAQNAVMSMFSVSAPVGKNIAVKLMRGKATMFDLEDDCSNLGYATRDQDGLFYIEGNQTGMPTNSRCSSPNEKIMMTTVKRNARIIGLNTKIVPNPIHNPIFTTNNVNDSGKLRQNRLRHAKKISLIRLMLRWGKLPH